MPPSGIPVKLLNGHADCLRAREPPSPEVRLEVEQLQRKRTIEPVVEDESEETPARAKHTRVRAQARGLDGRLAVAGDH